VFRNALGFLSAVVVAKHPYC